MALGISGLTEFDGSSWSFLVWRKKPNGATGVPKPGAHHGLKEGAHLSNSPPSVPPHPVGLQGPLNSSPLHHTNVSPVLWKRKELALVR